MRAAAELLRGSGFPDADAQLDGSLLEPVDPDWVTAYFEHAAGRGKHPASLAGATASCSS